METDMMIQMALYVDNNRQATNTQLFSLLALLNAYFPRAYLLMSECQKILGPPDPIHGGPPFEARMRPFITFIDTSSPSGHICMNGQKFAQKALELLASLGISRSNIANKFMVLLCGDQLQPHILQFIQILLTKRKFGVRGKEKFSRLIEDIRAKENFNKAVSVLTTASHKLRLNQIYPQTIARLYYTKQGAPGYGKAEEWAKKAIQRAPNNSYAADTLGQIYKNRLMREANQLEAILRMAEKAFKAFEDVEKKAVEEEGPEMVDTDSTVNFSNTFNNRGHFGFIQVANIAFGKLRAARPLQRHRSFIQNLEMKVQDKFDFFEWYLTYSKAGMTSVEPPYFWKDIALCYNLYTSKTAAESTSFPGLLDSLNHGLFTSKGRRAGLEEAEYTVSHFEEIRGSLKNNYEANDDDVKAAERYILSNIILSNKMHNSPQITSLKELQAIIHKFLVTGERCRSPEFYLLVLLLFWPEGEDHVVQEQDDEEVEQQTTEVDRSEGETSRDKNSDEEQETEQQTTEVDWSEGETPEDENSDEEQETEQQTTEVDWSEGETSRDKNSGEEQETEQQTTEVDRSEGETSRDKNSDEEQETRVEPAQLSLDFMFVLDLQQYVTFMETTFETTEYSKYLRGRYLLPLFFLGKGSGLRKWIHKSRLDAIVEAQVDADLAREGQRSTNKQKLRRINDMWITGDVWRVPEIEDMLLPVQVELHHDATMPQEHGEVEVSVYGEGKKIWAKTVVQPSMVNPRLFYLGFTIQGPVVFIVYYPQLSRQ